MPHQSVSLGKLVKIAQGFPLSRHRDDDGQSTPVVNVKDLEKLYVEHEPENFSISSQGNVERYRLKAGDVVIAIRGSLFKSSIVTKMSQGSIAGQNVAFFRLPENNLVEASYIAVLMRSGLIEQILNLKRRSSTTLPSIRISDLRELKIPLPEISIQKQIVQLFLLSEQFAQKTLEVLAARQELVETTLYQLLYEEKC